ncbi:PepSY domain-containing protein [Streptomyces viridosporus]|uniref:PepSY domain-containing protein n=1 Tax=Streptomyces viridosporus TaxID=67581 RepID=UPI000D1D085A|nr:PepSY domain-containing protein [Streptomyces viridosporus]
MRKAKLITLAGGGVLLSVTVGAAFASAGQSERASSGEQVTVRAASAAGFEIEIDPELDARFGPRPVNAVQAAGIVTDSRPGARVVKVELDEEGGRAVWEVEARDRGGDVEALVDAFTGRIVGQESEAEDEDD